VNAVIVGLSFMAYALFTKTMPHWMIYAILLTGGFFRSLQNTALNGLAYADIDERQMSGASTLSAIGQRLAQSIGIGLAASLVHLFQAQSGSHHVTAPSITPVFLITGAMAVASGLFFVSLPGDAGAELHDQAKPRKRLWRRAPRLEAAEADK
jgi:hypothetical protein